MWRSIALAFALAASFTAAALGQSRPPGYGPAEQAFNHGLDLRGRLDIQIDLIAAGYLAAVPTETFTLRVYEGLTRFQRERGLAATGILDPAQRQRLLGEASELYRMWQFKPVANPMRGRPIWMPTGMGLLAKYQPHQIAFQTADEKLAVSYRHLKRDLGATYNELLRGYSAGGVTVNYTAARPNWFVISTTNKDGVDGYLRYHRDGDGITGIAVFWNNDKGVVHGDRIAVLMSASLGSRMGSMPFLDPPAFDAPQVASSAQPAPQPPAPPPSAAAPAPPAAAPPAPRRDLVTAGTGFFVGLDGTVVTNEHVVSACSSIDLQTEDRTRAAASVIARDKTNDLAILRTSATPKRVASLRTGARLGEGVAAFGFPHSDILATSGHFTQGNITATAGLGDDTRFFQVSAPVHHGNSGGPLLDMRGSVVGVVTSKLNALKFASNAGDLPQNINFAVKASLLSAFLESHNVEAGRAAPDAPTRDPADIADLARAISVFIVCRP
ncbi:serine protease [Enterovirga sp.]|uniref:serine protease n=1 Tax=Enterovirga sp. TaxID=2026350 RepID=UPI0026359B2E|nr:serine protease [Enterovirga sp.]MDB5591326.1 Peptidoglycan-binding domain 1 protein [Enterovirga sp.]